MAERRLARTQSQLDALQREHEETLAGVEVLRARLAAAESRLAGQRAGGRLAGRGRLLAARARLAAVRAPHRLRAAAAAARRRLRNT